MRSGAFAAWSGLVLVSSAGAQTRVVIPGGTLRGAITNDVGQAGLSYALVTVLGADRRAFANEQGRFLITGLKPGADRVRVQQIGYAPVEIDVVLVGPGSEPAASDQLVIPPGAKIQVLPDLIVTADAGLRRYLQPLGCVAPTGAITDGTAQLVVDQAVTNADRILAVEQGYPFIVTFEHVREAYDSAERLRARWIDTIAINPAKRGGYRRGQVLAQARLWAPLDAVYFTMGDVARKEFQRAHCAWYMGTDSTDAGRTHRIDFEPAPGVKTADWAGSLQFDRETFQLVRSDARLVQVDPDDDRLQSALCAVRYGGEIPTIVHEQLALCLTSTGRSATATSRDIYRVIATRWLGIRPGDPPMERPR